MLYGRRKRLEDLARREAAGESLWSARVDDSARVRLVHLFDALADGYPYGERLDEARTMVCRDLGVFRLAASSGPFTEPVDDLRAALMTGDVDMVASILEAMDRVLVSRNERRKLEVYEATVSTLLSEHRISFELIDGQMVPFESREMHVEVVAPALTLLGGRAGWEGVERAYRKALEEVGNDPSDAVTDAGTALQEALTLLGCEGNALGPLAKDAVRKGLLAAHDRKLLDWVSADRSETGDSHNAAPATRDDAWLAAHVAGALLLRLAAGEPRGGRGA